MAALLLQLFMGWIWSWLVSVERVPVISVSFGTGLEKDVCDVLSLTLLAEMSLLTTLTAQLFTCGGAEISSEHIATGMTEVQSLCLPTPVFAASQDLSKCWIHLFPWRSHVHTHGLCLCLYCQDIEMRTFSLSEYSSALS